MNFSVRGVKYKSELRCLTNWSGDRLLKPFTKIIGTFFQDWGDKRF